MINAFVLIIFLAAVSFAEGSFAAKEADTKNDLVVKKTADDSLEVYPASELENKKTKTSAQEKNSEDLQDTEVKKTKKNKADESSETEAKSKRSDSEAPAQSHQQEQGNSADSSTTSEIPIPDPNAKIIEPSPVDKALDRFQQQQQDFEKRATGGY